MKIKWPAFGFACLLLACAAVAVQPASAQAAHKTSASATTPPASISDVEVTRSWQQTFVRISGGGDLHYQTSHMDSPARLVLDFPDTRLGVSQRKVSSDSVPVLDVRLGQPNPGQSRIVVDLVKRVPFTAQTEGSDLVLSFTAPAVEAIPATLRPIQKPSQRKLVAARAPEMPLPASLTGNNFSFARPSDEPLAPESAQPQNAPATGARAATSPQRYTGDPISVNLKDVDLKDFFRLIHEISGLNVVLDPSVRGTVTLVLDEVPWDQALDIVLRNNGLTKEIDGNVLRIATQDTLKHEADQRRDLLKAETDAIEPVTVTRVLSYAQANTMVVTLKKFLTPRGDLFADVRSNTLVIRDIPSSIPKIDDLIRQLDRKSQQVEIDARVVQASRSFARDVGTQFGFTTPTGASGNTAIGGLLGASSFLSPVIHSLSGVLPFATGGSSSSSSGSQIPLNTNLGATAPSSGLTFSTQGHNYAIDFMLSMMENKGLGKVLSEPKGVTQNNEKLTVKQGQKIPIQTNINNTISVQYVDAVLMLEVTPQITADGTVFLEITVENTQIDQGIPLIQGTPALDTQSTQTKVLVSDGGTVVIGGVVVTSQNTSIGQVPLLGNVPLIGNLFKHTTINVSTQELLFFVTPRILPG
jgi:type IV pilus assembly protein PilQ